MDDLISRQAAIDAVHKEFDDCIVWDESGMTTANEVERILDSVPSAQPEQRWIPCSERLPEKGKDVLVTRHYLGEEDNNKSCYYVELASRYGEEDDPVWTSYSDEYKIHPKNHIVIAWQYLPEPYRGEQK